MKKFISFLVSLVFVGSVHGMNQDWMHQVLFKDIGRENSLFKCVSLARASSIGQEIKRNIAENVSVDLIEDMPLLIDDKEALDLNEQNYTPNNTKVQRQNANPIGDGTSVKNVKKDYTINTRAEFFKSDKQNKSLFWTDCGLSLLHGCFAGGAFFLGQQAMRKHSADVQFGSGLFSLFASSYFVKKKIENSGVGLDSKMKKIDLEQKQNILNLRKNKTKAQTNLKDLIEIKKNNINTVKEFAKTVDNLTKNELVEKQKMHSDTSESLDILKDLALPSSLKNDQSISGNFEAIKQFIGQLRSYRLSGCIEGNCPNTKSFFEVKESFEKGCKEFILKEVSKGKQMGKDYEKQINQLDYDYQKNLPKYKQAEYYNKSYLPQVRVVVTVTTALLFQNFLNYFFRDKQLSIYDSDIAVEDNEENID